MSDLTEHLRKAGKVKTEKKTAASRATIAEARSAKEAKRHLRAMYVVALEEVVTRIQTGCSMASICAASDEATAIRMRIGGRK